MSDPETVLAEAIANYLADIEPVEQWPQSEDILLEDFQSSLEETVWDLAVKRMMKIRCKPRGEQEYVHLCPSD